MIKQRHVVQIFLAVACLSVGTLSGLAQDVPEDQYFNSDGVRIRYVERGTGQPIVLGHGFTNSLLGWIQTGVFDKLAENYRVVAFDHRGHGKSDKPHEVLAYGSEMGRDIFRLLDHLEIGKAHIIGYQMGSRIVGQLITTNPERFLTATLGASPPRRNWSDEDEQASQQLADDTLVLQTLLDAGQDVVALAALARARSDQAVADEELVNVRIPTIAIVGSEDPSLPGFNDLRTVMTDLEVVIIDGATHGGEEEAMGRPEFVEAIRSFIAGHSTER